MRRTGRGWTSSALRLEACLRYEEDGEGMDEFCTEIGGVSVDDK